MISGFRRFIGSVSVKQRAHEIVIEGIPADVMIKDIGRIWKTSRISMNMFNTLGRNGFSFNTFFASDIDHMLSVMIASRDGRVAKRTLRNIQIELRNATYLKNLLPGAEVTSVLDWDQLKNLTAVPYPHQVEWLKQYDTKRSRLNLNGDVLAAAPGTGKTLAGIMLAEMVRADYVFVVCPTMALDDPWRKTLSGSHKKPVTKWIIADGKPYNKERYLVIHYQVLNKLLAMIEKGLFEGKTVAILLDESHNLNEVVSLQTQLFEQVCKLSKSKNIIRLSGTPVKALGTELIPMLRTLDDLFTPDTEARYKKIFGKEATKALDIVSNRFGLISYKIDGSVKKLQDPIWKSIGIKVPDGSRFTLKAIKGDMERFIIERFKYYKERRSSDEALFNRCMDLHKQTLRTNDQKKAFEEYQRNLKTVIKIGDPRFCGTEIKATNAYEKKYIHPSLPADLRGPFKDVKSIVKYLKLKIQGECLGRVLGRTRIECAVAMAQNTDFVEICDSTLKKTVLFTSFVEALRETETQCQKHGLNPVLVYGATNNELASSVAKFGKDEAVNPLGATYQSLSTAVSLIMADTMILLNSPFRSYILEQAIARIHRIGQDSQTYIYQLYLDTGKEPNISTRAGDILKWSQDQVAAILGIQTPFDLKLGEGMEKYKEAGLDFDDAKLTHLMLNDAYADFDISISGEHFETPVYSAPALYSW